MIAEELIITLAAAEDGRARPYHRQVYEQVRGAILSGRLRPGDRLPATRDLAARLGLARNTVARAYGDLLAEGYLEGRVGSGTYVAPGLGGEAGAQAEGKPALAPSGQPRRLSDWVGRALREARDRQVISALPYDFRPGTPDWDAFPRTLWLQLLGRALRREAGELTRYGDPAGYLPLRQAIARHLAISRGVVTAADQVVIVSGSQQALDLLARLRVDPGEAVAVEDPGYPEARRVFAAADARLIPVPVDDEGLAVEELVRQREEPRIVYVTPSHQFPTGATLPLTRRLALLEWAARRDVLIVEDDYDSEFRYAGRPVESLQGLDRAGRVAYVGTFSTVLFPPFRVGYAVLPPDLVGPFVQAKWLADRQTPTLEQLALADFLEEGHFERHLRRMRRLAADRRAALLAAVEEHLGSHVAPPRACAGMHVMLRLAGPGPATVDGGPTALETAVVAGAAARGVGVYPVGSCRIRPSADSAILLGYAALPEDRIREGVRRLAEVVAEVRARRSGSGTVTTRQP